ALTDHGSEIITRGLMPNGPLRKPIILQAWLILPSCLASSRKPTFARIISCSCVISGLPFRRRAGAVPIRGENRARPPALLRKPFSCTTETAQNEHPIKASLLQISPGVLLYDPRSNIEIRCPLGHQTELAESEAIRR